MKNYIVIEKTSNLHFLVIAKNKIEAIIKIKKAYDLKIESIHNFQYCNHYNV